VQGELIFWFINELQNTIKGVSLSRSLLFLLVCFLSSLKALSF
jgi:hypothetical protein